MKTKVGSLSVIICFIIVVFFCILACDNGSVSDSSVAAKSNGLVKVSLTVDGGTTEIQKSISVNDTDLVSLTYQYNAVPQWQDPEGNNIHGTADWTTINYSDGMSLGYFSPGQWVFGIRILNAQNVVIYEGFSEVKDISNSSVPVTVTVNKLVKTAAKGMVRISVTAPTMQNETLSISYIKTDPASSGEADNITATSVSGRTAFDATVSDLSGSYTFTLAYSSDDVSEPIEGSIDVSLSSEEMAVISGHMDNGIWQIEYIKVKVNSLAIQIYNWGDEENPWAPAQYPVYYGNVFPNVTYAATGDRVSLSVEPDEDSELDPLDPLNPLEITYRNGNSDIPVDYTKNGNNMYTFFAPDGDVTVKAKFKSSVDIDPEEFMFHVHSLCMANAGEDIQYFGRSDNPPSPGLPSERIKTIKGLKIWYDENAHKICWYSGVNDNTVKFSEGSLAGLFLDGGSFISISLKYLNTSAINNMSHMFDSCLILQSVDLSNIDTSNVKDMSYMFYKAGYNDIPDTKSQGGKKQLIKKLNDHYLSITGMAGFNTENVKNMAYMFSGCSAQDLDVHSFDASRVTNFSHMFAGVTDPPSYSFYRPTKFISLALENWDVGKNVLENERIDMSNMFDICNMIEEISFTNNPDPEQETKAWKFDKVINMKEMFNRCESANKIIFPKHTDLTNVTSLCEIFNRDQEIPLTGSGSFTDIFSRWDISGNNYPSSGGGIEFTETPHDRDSKGESANRLMQDTDALTHLTSEEFNTYTHNIKVEIGSTNGNLAVEKQRLKKKIVN